jgi:hypothetical protein
MDKVLDAVENRMGGFPFIPAVDERKHTFLGCHIFDKATDRPLATGHTLHMEPFLRLLSSSEQDLITGMQLDEPVDRASLEDSTLANSQNLAVGIDSEPLCVRLGFGRKKTIEHQLVLEHVQLQELKCAIGDLAGLHRFIQQNIVSYSKEDHEVENILSTASGIHV